MPVKLTGEFEVPAETLAEVEAHLAAHVAATRAEPGCLKFEVTQSAGNPCVFTVDELFADRAAFEAHQARVLAGPWWPVTRNAERRYKLEEV